MPKPEYIRTPATPLFPYFKSSSLSIPRTQKNNQPNKVTPINQTETKHCNRRQENAPLQQTKTAKIKNKKKKERNWRNKITLNQNDSTANKDGSMCLFAKMRINAAQADSEGAAAAATNHSPPRTLATYRARKSILARLDADLTWRWGLNQLS